MVYSNTIDVNGTTAISSSGTVTGTFLQEHLTLNIGGEMVR